MTISIITACYNSKDTIRDTIESVLEQNFIDLEYIIVDGLSNDGTIDVIKEYEPKFHGRMRWISEKDNGLYDAMNKGIRMSTGEVIGFLNSDDFYTSNDILQLVVDAFDKDKSLDAVYGDVHFVDDIDLNKCVRYYSSKVFRRSLMRLGFMPAHPSFYCKREAYQNYGLFDTSFTIGADFENLLRLIYIHNIRTQYLPYDFVTMRTGGISTSGMQSHKQIMHDHLKAFKKNGVYSNCILLSLRYFYKVFELFNSKTF